MEDLSGLFDKATEELGPEALSTVTQLVFASAHAGMFLRYLPETKAELAALAREVKHANDAQRHSVLVRDVRDIWESLGRKPSVKTVQSEFAKRGVEAPHRNKLQAVLRELREAVDK